MYYITTNVQYIRYSTGRKLKYFIVYRLSILPSYVVRRTGTTNRVVVPARQTTKSGIIDSLELVPGLYNWRDREGNLWRNAAESARSSLFNTFKLLFVFNMIDSHCYLPNAAACRLNLNSGQNLQLGTGLAHIRLPHPVARHHGFLRPIPYSKRINIYRA